MENFNSVDTVWLNSEQAAQLLLISRKRLYNLTYLGLVPSHKFFKSLRFKKDEILSLVIQNNSLENVWSNMTKRQNPGMRRSHADIRSLRCRYQEEGLALKLNKKR